ncbi:related to SOK1 protein [Rhynchosporium secalis]|uniref:Related to SOK1 protein n=1 Tax=Rhynchosporium secalis TaxID=38038 RepID=A0A1E1M7S2_RHYSE|nr:related to SOK1 protein [Rhynchosporium secalis]
MDSDASKRVRTNSVAAANDHTTSPPSNDGSMPAQQSQDSRSQATREIQINEKGYDAVQGNTSGGSPLPRNQPNYGSSTARRTSRQTHSNYAPSKTATSPRASHTKFTSKQAERPTTVTVQPQPISIEPPVTKGTLNELDVIKIVNNPKLRHDVNFDPELHFRPNLDGEKGRRKTEKANYFWYTMTGQLQAFLTNRDQFERELGDSEWCLPATLNAIRGILGSLVPAQDQDSVGEMFNVELLMQQFRMGVADLGKLALWLSNLLKSHCAPMRDNWIDDMVRKLSEGGRTGEAGMLVAGMKNLLGILEAMKLDIANHQIRCLRPLLLNDAVHFEQRFFMKKIALGRVDITGAHAWYREATALPGTASGSTTTHSQTCDFIKAMLQLIRPSGSEIFPHTFLFDEERLIKLRADILDLVNLEICMQLYRTLEARTRSYRDDTPTTPFASSPFNRPASPADETLYSSPTIPSLRHFLGHPSGKHSWVPKVNDSQIGSSAPSPRSSPSSTASTPNTIPLTPLYLTPVSPDSSCQLRTSLLAILSSSTSPAKKWDFLSPDLALQILRQTSASLVLLPQFEVDLALHLSNPKSTVYKDAEEFVLGQFNVELTKLVENYTPMSNLQIFEAATAPKAASSSAAVQGNAFKAEVTEMATRMAHIGILHWRVWAPLAYLVDPDAVDLDMEEEIAPQSERPTSMP